MNLHQRAKFILLIFTVFISQNVSSLSTDRDKPLEIEADSAELDDMTGITTYKGNVIVVQGSMRLQGSKLTIYYTETNAMKKVVMVGAPATFVQLPDNSDQQIEGEGIKIEYAPPEDLLILTENAQLLQGGKLFKAHHIAYDTKKSLLKARKVTAGETTPSGKEPPKNGGRIKVILPPKKK